MSNTQFSRDVVVSSVPNKGLRMKVTLEPAEIQQICEEFTLLSIETFEAKMFLERLTKNSYKLSGNLRAHVQQPCVISFEPVDTFVDEDIDLMLVPEHEFDKFREKMDEEGALVMSPDLDVPDTFQGDVIEVGGFVLEHLALGLNPYPHVEGAVLEKTTTDEAGTMSPFAGLSELKSKMKPN